MDHAGERKDGAAFLAAPVPEEYEIGARGLNVRALARLSGSNTFRREDVTAFEEGGRLYRLALEATVELDVDPATVPLPAACRMEVTLSADADWGDAPAEQGSERFTLPCRISERDGRVLVIADGFEPETLHSAWSDYFEAHGVWARHSGLLSNALFDLFRPVLEVDRTRPEALLQNHGDAWYAEMKNPPPQSIE
ncbi:MAG: hypothetical protein IRZ16_02195 [Myxococcaceae bacterium]|nr:hypothetical protein [Myxococcaceae bacterium]